MDKDRCSRPLSSDLQYFDLRLSNPSPDSSQVQTYPRENWREPNMTSQYSSNSSSYPHHPSSWLPSSSSTSNSSYGRETRFPRPNSGRSSYLAPPLAPYVAPFHEQPLHSDDRHPTLRVDGHSSAFSQHPPPKHGVTAAEGGSHSLSPLRSASRSYSYENTSYSPRTREVYSSSQTPTMMQFSKLTANEQEEITAGLPPPQDMEVSSRFPIRVGRFTYLPKGDIWKNAASFPCQHFKTANTACSSGARFMSSSNKITLSVSILPTISKFSSFAPIAALFSFAGRARESRIFGVEQRV